MDREWPSVRRKVLKAMLFVCNFNSILSSAYRRVQCYQSYSPVAQSVKNMPAMQEIRILGQEDPLEKEMATPSSTLACGGGNRLSWTPS